MSKISYNPEVAGAIKRAIPLLEEAIANAKQGVAGYREVAATTGAPVMISNAGVLEEKGAESLKDDEEFLERLLTIARQYDALADALGVQQ